MINAEDYEALEIITQHKVLENQSIAESARIEQEQQLQQRTQEYKAQENKLHELEAANIEKAAIHEAEVEFFRKSWAAYFAELEKIKPPEEKRILESKAEKIEDKEEDPIKKLKKELDEIQKAKDKITEYWGAVDWKEGLDIRIDKLFVTVDENGVKQDKMTPKMRDLAGLTDDQLKMEIHGKDKNGNPITYTLEEKSKELDEEYRERLSKLKEKPYEAAEPEFKKWEDWNAKNPEKAVPIPPPEVKKQFSGFLDELVHFHRRLGALNAANDAGHKQENRIRRAAKATAEDPDVQDFEARKAKRRDQAPEIEQMLAREKSVNEQIKNYEESRAAMRAAISSQPASNIPEAPPLEPEKPKPPRAKAAKPQTVFTPESKAYEPEEGATALLPNRLNAMRIAKKTCEDVKKSGVQVSATDAGNEVHFIDKKGEKLCSMSKADGAISTDTEDPKKMKSIFAILKETFKDVAMTVVSATKQLGSAISDLGQSLKMKLNVSHQEPGQQRSNIPEAPPLEEKHEQEKKAARGLRRG